MHPLKIFVILHVMLLSAVLAVDFTATELEYFQTRNHSIDPSYMPEIAVPPPARPQPRREEARLPPN